MIDPIHERGQKLDRAGAAMIPPPPQMDRGPIDRIAELVAAQIVGRPGEPPRHSEQVMREVLIDVFGNCYSVVFEPNLLRMDIPLP